MTESNTLPKHLGVILDGNRRWARERGLPTLEGHRRGYENLWPIMDVAIARGVTNLSAYAFSTENWKRSPEEVAFLMRFTASVMARRIDEIHALGVRVRWAGRRPKLWRSVIGRLEELEAYTKDNDVLDLVLCVNYGGRAEIADAAAALAREAAAGRINPDRISERTFARYLDEPDMPDVDLLIRTSGEQRVSNFLLWQAWYAEMAFVDTLWPDFDRLHLWKLCEEYARRGRRYGGVEEP